MRVLFVTKHLRVGGAQRNWTILLPALARRGFTVRLLTLEDEGEFFDELRGRGIAVACVRMRGRLDLGAGRRAVGTASWGPAVVASHDERSHVVARAIARRAGAAHVAVDHGGPGFRLELHREALLRLVAPGFDAAVTMSERRVPDLLARRFPRDRIHVIPNGVDPAALGTARSPEEVRAGLGIRRDAFVALLLAVLRPEKRAERFVSAVARARELEPRIHGLVAGYGPEESRIRRLAAEAGPAIDVLGHRSDVADLVAAADVVCLTSDTEGGPYAAIEAMALGRPVLATRVGAIDEVVVDGQTGLLVPPEDETGLACALVRLAREPERGRSLGAAGRTRQRALFDAERMGDAYAELLRTVADAQPRTSPGRPSRT